MNVMSLPPPSSPITPVSRRFLLLTVSLFASLFAWVSVTAATGTYNVRENGAVGDGHSLDTEAINQTILKAAKAGGGTVYFPAGTYLSYSIHLQNNIALYLDQGATLLAAEPPADLSIGYDHPEPNPGVELYQDFGHSHWHNSLIWGENLENISILGPGRIFGRGLSGRVPRAAGLTRRDLLPEERELPPEKQPNLSLPAEAMAAMAASMKPGPFGYPDPKDSFPPGVGNKAIALKNCHNVILRDFSIYHGGHFAILATGVDNFTLDNLKIDTNRDAIDIDCCKDVQVTNCRINSPHDDGLCLKSTYALGYIRPTENVTITNCIVSGYDEGTVLNGTFQRKSFGVRGSPTGRIKCGTEGTGGFRNITISNCVFEFCRGLALESVDGALMEDITVSNIAMRDIFNAPIYIRLGARLRGPGSPPIGTARRIKISNVVASNVAAVNSIILDGMPGSSLEDIDLSHISIQYAGGGTREQGERTVPEMIKEYPDPSRYGTVPSYGMFARHVRNLTFDHIQFSYAKEELRPCLFLQDIAGIDFSYLKADHAAHTPILILKGVSDLNIQQSTDLADTRRAGPISDEKL